MSIGAVSARGQRASHRTVNRSGGFSVQGLSGPAALKLSAFGARELSEGGYKGKLVVNWLAGSNANKVSRAW